MKILILSDSHGSLSDMRKVMMIENPQMVFFLGDGWRDIRQLMSDYPDVPFHAVAGNCDTGSKLPDQITVNVQGINMLLEEGRKGDPLGTYT